MMEKITNSRGRVINAEIAREEPYPGSVVMTHGEFGTAWQRSSRDGQWHPTFGTTGPKPWRWLLTRRHLILLHDAEARPNLTGKDIDALLEEG